jgi:hypothetical protein
MVETTLWGAELARALCQPILWPGADTAFLNSLFPSSRPSLLDLNPPMDDAFRA